MVFLPFSYIYFFPKHTDPIHCHLWKKWFTGIFVTRNKETLQMFFGHNNMFIYKNFKFSSDQALNFLVFFKPNIFRWFVLQSSVWHLNHWNGMFYVSKSKKLPDKTLNNTLNQCGTLHRSGNWYLKMLHEWKTYRLPEWVIISQKRGKWIENPLQRACSILIYIWFSSNDIY